MKVAINDLSFQYCFYDLKTADDALHEFLGNYLEIKKERYRNVVEIRGAKIDCEFELVPGYKLFKLIQNFKTHDERWLLISLLANAPSISNTGSPVCIDGKTSYACAFAKDGAVISLNSHFLFSNPTLKGELDGRPCDIRNIAQFVHISQHSAVLGRRKYEKNPKHRQAAYSRADTTVSPMDLSDTDAQEALDQAVEVNGRIFAKIGDIYYELRNHHENVYHGYRNDQIEADIKKKIEQELAKK